MIEHVIAFAVNDAAFEYGIVESTGSHDFFRDPFRLVIARAASRSGAQEADEANFRNSCTARSRNHMACAINMNAPIRLPANFAIYTGAMRYGIAPGEGFCKLIRIVQAYRDKTDVRELTNRRIRLVSTASDENHFVSLGCQCSRDVTADEASTAGNGYFHKVPPFHAAHA